MKVIGDRLFVALVKRIGTPSREVLRRCRDRQLESVRRGVPRTLFHVTQQGGWLDAAQVQGFLRCAEQVAQHHPDFAEDLFEPDAAPLEAQVPDALLPPDSCRESGSQELLVAHDLGPIEVEGCAGLELLETPDPAAAPFEESGIGTLPFVSPGQREQGLLPEDVLPLRESGSTIEGAPLALAPEGHHQAQESQWDSLLGDLVRGGLVPAEQAARHRSGAGQRGSWDALLSELERDGLIGSGDRREWAHADPGPFREERRSA